MNHGQKPLSDWTKEEMMEAIQDYQELVSELESEANAGHHVGPYEIRRLIEQYVCKEPKQTS